MPIDAAGHEIESSAPPAVTYYISRSANRAWQSFHESSAPLTSRLIAGEHRFNAVPEAGLEGKGLAYRIAS